MHRVSNLGLARREKGSKIAEAIDSQANLCAQHALTLPLMSQLAQLRKPHQMGTTCIRK